MGGRGQIEGITGLLLYYKQTNKQKRQLHTNSVFVCAEFKGNTARHF